MLCFKMISSLLFSACGILLLGTQEISALLYPATSLGEVNLYLMCDDNAAAE